MFIRLFVVCLLLVVCCCNAAPLAFTQQMKENLFPDTAINFAKHLTPEELATYGKLYDKFRGNNYSMTGDGGVKMMVEMEIKYPDMYKKIKPVLEDITGKMSTMSDDETEFFRYYAAHGANIKSSSDKEISKFLCDVLPKWKKLDNDSKKDLGEKWPKMADNLNSESIQKLADCKA